MSNKWETARIDKEEFTAEYMKYLKGEYQSKYPIAEKYHVDFYTVGRIAKRFGLPKKSSPTQIDIDVFVDVYNRFARREIKDYEACKELKISMPTFYKWLGALWNNGLSLTGLPFLFDEEKWREENL